MLGLGVTMKKFAGVFAAVSLIAGLGAAPAYAFQEPELVRLKRTGFPRTGASGANNASY